MLNKKKIIFLTSTRADYGKLKTLIKIFEKSKNYQTEIFVTGMHNMKLYGNTISEIKKDRIKNIYVFNNQNKNSSMTDILMETISGFKNYIRKLHRRKICVYIYTYIYMYTNIYIYIYGNTI